MNAEEQELVKPAGTYIRELGKDVLADIHVHGILGTAALVMHKFLGAHLNSEELAIIITMAFVAGTVLVFAMRRLARRRREKKNATRFEWTNHL